MVTLLPMRLSWAWAQAQGAAQARILPECALGERSPIYFSNSQPDFARGIHFSLYNNGWGTNYIQWFGEDAASLEPNTVNPVQKMTIRQ